MSDADDQPEGSDLEEIKIVVNALHLSLVFLLRYIENSAGKDAATEARNDLIEGVKAGSIDMAIMEDRKTYDFVVSVVEKLPAR